MSAREERIRDGYRVVAREVPDHPEGAAAAVQIKDSRLADDPAVTAGQETLRDAAKPVGSTVNTGWYGEDTGDADTDYP